MTQVGKKRVVLQAREVHYKDGKQIIGKSKSITIHASLDEIWKKIKKALGTQTREQAAAIVQADDKARQLVLSLFSGADQTLLTRPATRAESFISAPPQSRTPLAEQMYGSKKAKVTF